ncbi:MAG: putative SOS response-associated peptidase YedK [Crocinitomix sp.]|jgi:putative SOS response-associated peptidase YedK
MCYSISQAKRKAYLSALKDGVSRDELERLYGEWQQAQHDEAERDTESPMAFVNGFEHPKLFTLVKEVELKATRFTWGLIPSWTKNKTQATEIRNKTLNARGESIFEKASFKESALDKRCLVFVNGFFEYYHFKGKTYPNFIQHTEKDKPLVFGGLWSEWTDHLSGEVHQSAAIVTTQANELMTSIHNNPKANGARMPLILESDNFDQWLTAENRKEVEELIKPLSDGKLKAHTVKRLVGKNGVGDSEEATAEHFYADLNEQGTLF